MLTLTWSLLTLLTLTRSLLTLRRISPTTEAYAGASARDSPDSPDSPDSAAFERDAVGRLPIEDGLSRMFGENRNRVVERTGVCGGGHSAVGGSGEKEVGATESEDDVFVV